MRTVFKPGYIVAWCIGERPAIGVIAQVEGDLLVIREGGTIRDGSVLRHVWLSEASPDLAPRLVGRLEGNKIVWLFDEMSAVLASYAKQFVELETSIPRE